jgi:hypothetical protein
MIPNVCKVFLYEFFVCWLLWIGIGGRKAVGRWTLKRADATTLGDMKRSHWWCWRFKSSWDVTYRHLASTVIGPLCMWRSGTAHPTTQCHFCEELNLVVWFSAASSPTHHLGWPHTLQVWYVSCLIPLAFSFVTWTSLDVKLDDTRQFSCPAVWYFTGVFDVINSYCFSK